MQCRTCQYSLEEISERRCPECGRDFDPGNPTSYIDRSASAYSARETAVVAWVLGVLIVIQLVIGYTRGQPFLLSSGVFLTIPATLVLLSGMCLTRARVGAWSLLLSTLPAGIIIAGIGTLAFHMQIELGGWPSTIGTAEFSDLLRGHGELAGRLFSIGVLLALPALALGVVTLFIRRIRTAAILLAIFVLSIAFCLVFIDLLPKGFSDWWWD